MIDHKIHDDSDIPFMCFGEHLVKVFHRAEICHDVAVIGNVISVVIVRRAIYRRKPYHVNSELFQIIEAGSDSLQVADPVSIGIRKAPWIDLINNCLFPPCMSVLCIHPVWLFLSVNRHCILLSFAGFNYMLSPGFCLHINCQKNTVF